MPTIGYGGAEMSLTRIAGYLSEQNKINIDLVVAKKLDKSDEINISSDINITYLNSKKQYFLYLSFSKLFVTPSPTSFYQLCPHLI